MKKPVRLVFFTLAAAAALAAPAALILKFERILREGHPYRFRVQPVDPYDAFRGRYVSLSFRDLAGRLPPGVDDGMGRDVQVLIETGSDGFARVAEIADKPPAGDRDYVTMETGWHPDFYSNRTVRLNPPFASFFMNETLAPLAERAVRRRETSNVWADVRVLKGQGVIENLMIDGVPAADYVRDQLPAK